MHVFAQTLAIGLITAVCMAADSPETTSKRILVEAIRSRGEPAGSALEMLGAIDDATIQTFLTDILASKDGGAIDDMVTALTPAQCLAHLSELGTAARDPGIPFNIGILGAISRAGTREAAEILIDVANGGSQPTSGVAFGFLDAMGKVSEPFLANTVLQGKLAESRETAVAILNDMKDRRALPAFRTALRDSDEKVRVAAAIGLAQFGYKDGIGEIEAAAADSSSPYYVAALVSLAKLGRPAAFDKLKSLVASSDEAVRSRAVWAIARSGSTSLKDFAYRLGLERQPAFLIMLADRLLDPKDSRDRSILEEMMTTGNEMSRLIAACRLLETPAPGQAESIITRALASDNSPVRHFALAYAARRPTLRSALTGQLGSSDPNVQVAAMSAVVDLRQSDRFREIAPYLASEIRQVSAAAARAMVALDPVASKRVAEEGLNAANPHVRIHSAAMLLAIAAHIQTQ